MNFPDPRRDPHPPPPHCWPTLVSEVGRGASAAPVPDTAVAPPNSRNFASADSLRLLFYTEDLLAKCDEAPPRPLAPEYRLYNCREREVLANHCGEDPALLRPFWAFLERMLRRVHICTAVMAPRRALAPDATQEVTETS